MDEVYDMDSLSRNDEWRAQGYCATPRRRTKNDMPFGLKRARRHHTHALNKKLKDLIEVWMVSQ
jgi:hypothetical protein